MCAWKKKMTQETLQELLAYLHIIKNALGYVSDYLDTATSTPEQKTYYLARQEEVRTMAYLALYRLHYLIKDNTL